MNACELCGAPIDPLADACPFCKTMTKRGAEHRLELEYEAQARAQWEAQRTWLAQQALVQSLDRTATRSLVFSLIGLVVCCPPFGIAGIVQGLRARSMARQFSMTLPTSGRVGLVLSLLGTFTSISLLSFWMYQEHASRSRIEELKLRVANEVAAATLSHDAACALAEAHLVEHGHDGHPGYSLDRIECPGAVRGGDGAAELEAFRFVWSTTSHYEVSVCFKKGATWYVTELSKGPCDGVKR